MLFIICKEEVFLETSPKSLRKSTEFLLLSKELSYTIRNLIKIIISTSFLITRSISLLFNWIVMHSQLKNGKLFPTFLRSVLSESLMFCTNKSRHDYLYIQNLVDIPPYMKPLMFFSLYLVGLYPPSTSS